MSRDVTNEKQKKGGENYRRTWNKEYYLLKSNISDILEKEKEKSKVLDDVIKSESNREYLSHLEGQVGRTSLAVQTPDGSFGYYCRICECTLKDSLSYLGHINGRRHQKLAGVKKIREGEITAEQVRARIAMHAERRKNLRAGKVQNENEEEEKEKIADLDARVAKYKEKLAAFKQEVKRGKKQ